MNEQVAAAYQRCRELHRRHGRSYYLATRLLPAASRRHVHALYGFTRTADDMVDTPGRNEPAQALTHLADRLHAGLADPAAVAGDPILPAVVRTVRELDLDVADLDRFLASMAMDLTVARYETYDDLLVYMDGSAAVIGTMLLPILAPADRDAAREPARQLGLAFQLTNFIRDIAEDLGRGRVYLPQADLRECGVRVEDLQAATVGRGLRAAGPAIGPIRSLIGYAMSRARIHYAAAQPGIDLLPPASARCVRVAHRVYGAILDEIEARGRDVFAERVVVSPVRRIRLALTAALR
ncbi:MAG: phytoene/squalene synthase family protein [Hamadaea sp.]|uniref:phytoene/squalene synthase family protein n=1 Tax=Hamadaea sp. TaxID=2024425 RepID=UPI0018113727|nr:phytoene/squalene synthase family protein [Hamadaea sp.]NUR74603.1 phytoene/squalene synthase family protein [Hamadaea sp.]NUT17619.1 phytoene/squalene synthase family protein [Hamadaea sp.]